jgi:hypothetical protein
LDDLFTLNEDPRIAVGDFLVPWGMVIGTLGFLGVDRGRSDGASRTDTHLPLFVALAVFLGCVVGLIFSLVKISRPHLVTFAMVTLAAVATCVLYWRYSTKPWTHDGQVRANVVGIAPRVAGPIIQIPIKDQAVRKGDLLFEIDPSTFQAASITSAKPSTGCGFPTGFQCAFT